MIQGRNGTDVVALLDERTGGNPRWACAERADGDADGTAGGDDAERSGWLRARDGKSLEALARRRGAEKLETRAGRGLTERRVDCVINRHRVPSSLTFAAPPPPTAHLLHQRYTAASPSAAIYGVFPASRRFKDTFSCARSSTAPWSSCYLVGRCSKIDDLSK